MLIGREYSQTECVYHAVEKHRSLIGILSWERRHIMFDRLPVILRKTRQDKVAFLAMLAYNNTSPDS